MADLDISKLQEVKFYDLKDPFKKDYWEDIVICIPKNGQCIADISFQNGRTYGSHQLIADSPADLFKQLDGFLESLKAMT